MVIETAAIGHARQAAVPRKPSPRFELDNHEPLTLGLQRVVLEQLDLAVFMIRHEPDPEKAVHEARKTMKRTRGVLRLVRGELGTFRYRQENVVLRDVARRLSAIRAAAVTIETAEMLADEDPSAISPFARRRLVALLTARLDALRDEVLHHPELRIDALTSLLCLRSRVGAYPVVELAVDPKRPGIRPFPDCFASIAPGVHRTYRRGRVAMTAATASATVQGLHDWRKRVKYLRYQVEVLTPLWPEVLGATAGRLADLADVLGEDHDLADLAAVVATDRSLVPDERTRRNFLGTIERRRATRQRDAFSLGALLYDEPPDVFVRRVGAAWSYARA